MPTKALVVLSGGQDSCTCLFWTKQKFEKVKAITFNYGQRHSAELSSAMKIAAMADVEHEIVNIPNILVSRSPLTDPNVTLETYTDYDSMDKIIGNRVELTFVPMRNALFFTLAANRALYWDCYNLVTGVCEADNANYSDCRQVFIEDQERAINAAIGLELLGTFKIHTPLMHLPKAETVKLAHELPGCWEALAYSHTCYAGKTPPCILTEKQACHACTLRQHGFEQAGYPDPLIERWQKELAHST